MESMLHTKVWVTKGYTLGGLFWWCKWGTVQK